MELSLGPVGDTDSETDPPVEPIEDAGATLDEASSVELEVLEVATVGLTSSEDATAAPVDATVGACSEVEETVRETLSVTEEPVGAAL